MVTTYRRCHLVVFGTVSHKAAVDLASLDRSHHHLLIALTAHVLFSTWSLHVAHPPGYQPTMHHRRGRDCHRLLACRRLAVIRSIMSSATLQSKADTCGGSHRLTRTHCSQLGCMSACSHTGPNPLPTAMMVEATQIMQSASGQAAQRPRRNETATTTALRR